MNDKPKEENLFSFPIIDEITRPDIDMHALFEYYNMKDYIENVKKNNDNNQN